MRTGGPALPVAVGVDGSGPGRRAVRWAAHEAARRGTRLVLLHALDVAPPHHGPGSDAGVDELGREAAAGATDLLDGAVADVAEIGGVAAEARWDPHSPADALQVASRDSALVVLGAAGRGALGTALGSVTLTVAARAECPVVVVRGRAPDDAAPLPVLVGVDGGPLSDVALAHAFDAAARYGVPLRALHASGDADGRRARHALAERLAGWRERCPGVEVDHVVERADPGEALTRHSGRSRLAVVATRGRGGVAGLLLGSTGLALIRYSGCPVMLVGPDAAPAP